MAEVDIATLGIKVDATSADDATGQLDNLTNAATRTETATKGVASGSDAMRAAIAAAIGAINANSNAISGLTSRMDNMRASTQGAGAASDDMESKVNRLRASIDPMGAAIERVNQELAEARVMFEAGALSAEDYARAQVVLNARSADFARRQGLMNDAMGVGARSAKLQAHEVLNLSRQFADIGVTAAMGMNPLMILIQQGPQIADVLGTARARGISAGDAFRQMGAPLVRFLPLITGIGIAAGVAFAALGLATRGANEDVKAVQKEFGLTEKQMDRLKEKGTDLGYTFGDVFAGMGNAISGAITDAFGPEIEAVGKWWNELLDDITSGVTGAMRWTVENFVGAVYAIKDSWSLLPAALGDVAIRTANFVIKAIEDMINSSIGLINSMIDSIPEFLRPDGRLGTVSFGELANQFEGGASDFMAAAEKGFAKGKGKGSRFVDKFSERYYEGKNQSREDRIREDAGDADKPRAGRKPRKERESEEEKDWKRALEGAQNYTKAMQEQTEEIGKTAFQVKMLQTERKSAELEAAALALGTASAHAQAHEEIEKMRRATEEWIKATNAQKIKEMKQALQDESDQIAFETSLIGMNHEQRERAIKLREINLKILAAERDGYLGVAEGLRAEAEALGNSAASKGAMEDRIDAAQRATDHIRSMNEGIREATESFGELFGTAGEGFSNLLETVLNYNEQVAESAQRRIELEKELQDGQISATEYAQEKADIDREAAQAQIAHYGNMLSAAKTFFKEGSTGWKVMEAAERVYRLFQFAMAIRAMFLDKAQTASSVANSGARAAADGVAAVAKAIASLPFPLNIVAGAATLAFLVGIGVKMFGGGKGGSGGGGGGASQDAEKLTEKYNGPRDQYGAPTSYYSVLRPGDTTVAAQGFASTANGGTTIKQGDLNVTVQGNMVRDTMDELMPVLQEFRQQTVQDSRQAVQEDQNARSQRQNIGGGW